MSETDSSSQPPTIPPPPPHPNLVQGPLSSASSLLSQSTGHQGQSASATPTSSGNSKAFKLLNLFRVHASGRGLNLVPVKRPVTFSVFANGFDQDDISVIVTAPSNREIPFRLDTVRKGHYEVEYITPEVGEHVIEILACGKPIPGNPFSSSAYDASKIKVGPIPNGTVGQPVQFELESSEAGSGNLEILVEGGRVTSEVRNLEGNNRFLASFIPHTATMHIIEMKFNGEHVPGSPWKCLVTAPGTKPPPPTPNSSSTSSSINPSDHHKKGLIKVKPLELFPCGQTVAFDIIAPGFKKDDINIAITGPSKISVQYKILDVQNDTYRVYFNVSLVGTYLFEINVEGQPLMTQSFTGKAYDISRIHVTDIPRTCPLSHKCEFQVDASLAGEGQLEIAVNDGDVPNQVQVLGNGKCLVSFRPESVDPHIVDIKFNGENVPSCPFTVQITDSAQFTVDLSHSELVPVGRPARFTISCTNPIHLQHIKVSVTSPSGKLLPVTLETIDSSTTCELVPFEVGPHAVNIMANGKDVSSGPMHIKAYDARKVVVLPAVCGSIGKPVQFVVDASTSGEGNLEIAVNAKGQNIVTQVHPMGGAKFGVSFVPNENVDHFVSITFNNESVAGSPFKVTVNPDMDKISVSGAVLQGAPINQVATLTIHNVQQEQDIAAKIEGPNKQIIPATLKNDPQNHIINVEFQPSAPGEYLAYLHYRGNPLAGSPFSCKIYDLSQIKVKEMPKEIKLGTPVTFIVEASGCGPGNLEVIVNNGKVPSTPQALGPSLYAISFVPRDSERHLIDIKFNGEPVPGSPFVCEVLDATKVTINREGTDRVPVNQPAIFNINPFGSPIDIQNSLSILGPNHEALRAEIEGDSVNGYKVAFRPSEVGDHVVDLKVAGASAVGCPFIIKAFDSKRVRVSEITSGQVAKPVYFTIDASSAGAGNLEIIVSANGRNVPNYVQSEGNAKFRVNFKPMEAAMHSLSVKFNGESVPGSPFSVKVTDAGNQSLISSASLKMASINKGVEFVVESKDCEGHDCKAIVISPSGKKLPVDVTPQKGGFSVKFSPSEVGPHQVSIAIDTVAIPGSPFTCNVYDVNKIKVSGLGPGFIGVPLTFQVDASQAGEGTLELVVTTRKSSVRAEVVMKSRGLYNVTFIPQEKLSHYINITFNEEDVPQSPFKIEIKDAPPGSAAASRRGQEQSNGHHAQLGGLIGSVNAIDIAIDASVWNLESRVTGPEPQRALIPSSASKVDGKIRVEYQPREIGLHKIELVNKEDMSPLLEAPVLVEVCDPSRVKVVDVHDGVVGREQSFKIDASRAGRGNLSINIRAGDRDVKYMIHETSVGVYTVNYVPKIDTTHLVDVRYNGHSTPGCPQAVEIRDPNQSIIVHGIGLKKGTPGRHATFLIETGGFAAAKDFDVIISDPFGSPLAVKCYQQKDGSLLAEWTPHCTGAHKIDVLYRDKQVSGSPFTCEVFDASKVVLQRIKATTFPVNEKIVFTLNRKNAGFAELDVTVTSPLGRHLPIEIKGTPDGEGELIEFIPTVPGKYKIGITFGNIEVPGSPVTFIAQEEGVSPKVDGQGLYRALINEMASFKIETGGLIGTPEVRVDGPDSEAIPQIEKVDDVYHVSYCPVEVGVFDVRVLWNGRDVPGSPFHPKIVNLEKVRPIGGWENILDADGRLALAIDQEKRLSFDVSDAGPGEIKAKIKDMQSMEEAKVSRTGPSKYRISFTPKMDGEHQIYIYFADFPLPRSPFYGTIVSESEVQSSESATVVLRGHGLAGARVGEEAEFTIDGSEAGPGSPQVTLTGVKADIPVKVIPVSGKLFKATYAPAVPGTYLLNVHWGNKQVKGCPLKVSILPTCDANKVICTGEGLKHGAIGKEIKAFLDTRRAGPGELTAHCVGPQKVAYCELYDQMDGTFILYLKPQEGGKHTLTIKYGGEHVPGSPFTVRIAGAPDASKVRVYGPGVEHGVLPLYQSRFICDTRGAGAGQLTVRIRGPKGAFRVEMQRESQKDRTILCKYDPTEPGDYRIEVKWSGEHVPGSPFTVMIFDTQEELQRYLSGNLSAPSVTGLPIADYFGSTLSYATGYGQMSWRGSSGDI